MKKRKMLNKIGAVTRRWLLAKQDFLRDVWTSIPGSGMIECNGEYGRLIPCNREKDKCWLYLDFKHQKFRLAEGYEVHHIVSRSRDPKKRNDLHNLAVVSRAFHELYANDKDGSLWRKHAEEEYRAEG